MAATHRSPIILLSPSVQNIQVLQKCTLPKYSSAKYKSTLGGPPYPPLWGLNQAIKNKEIKSTGQKHKPIASSGWQIAEHTKINNKHGVISALQEAAFGARCARAATQWQEWSRTDQLTVLCVSNQFWRPWASCVYCHKIAFSIECQTWRHTYTHITF